MKSLFTLSILLYTLLLLSSCEQEVDTYHWEDCINFEVKQLGVLCDTSVYTFAYEEEDVEALTIVLHVQLTGKVKEYDRKININDLMADPKTVSGKHYSFQSDSCVIKAGKSYIKLPVTLLRQHVNRQDYHYITLEISENEHFKTTNREWILDAINDKRVNLLCHTVSFSDIITRPITWFESDGTLGTFSAKKFLLICEVTGLKRKDFQDISFMGSGRKGYIKELMNIYFNEYKKAHANDPVALEHIQETDGSFMQMGPW